MLELTLLSAMLRREDYERLHRRIPRRVFDSLTLYLLDSFGKYFATHPDIKVIQPKDFGVWFLLSNPSINEEAAAVWRGKFEAMARPVDPAVLAGLNEQLLTADLAFEVTGALERWNDGQEIDLGPVLQRACDGYSERTQRKVESEWNEDDIDDILAEDENDSGLHWPLESMNRALRPLRSGDFVIAAARPDRGKTSLIAFFVTHFAKQVDALFPGENRDIVWLNNEGLARRLKSRAYQAALGKNIDELLALRKGKGKVRSAYIDALGGRDCIKIKDIHGATTSDIEGLLKTVKPAVLVFDMLDNISFGGSIINGGTRTDQFLESMYQWARVLGVKHDCAVIATSQVSGEGADLPYPSDSMLKDSKTGKQGAADLILMLGHSADPSLSGVRWLSAPKNKLRRPTGGTLRQELLFQHTTSRFIDSGE